MKARILPADEWHRLAHTEFKHLPYVSSEELEVVVVEDDGRIVGCWGLMPMLHLEGLWIDPAYRGRPSVARRLLSATWAQVKKRSPRWVMTAATDDSVKTLLGKVGAIPLHADSFVIPTQGEQICRLLH